MEAVPTGTVTILYSHTSYEGGPVLKAITVSTLGRIAARLGKQLESWNLGHLQGWVLMLEEKVWLISVPVYLQGSSEAWPY